MKASAKFDVTTDRLGRPREQNIIYFELDGPTDEKGLTPFTRVWWDHFNSQWRGQCFRANLDTHLQQARKTGKHVKVIST